MTPDQLRRAETSARLSEVRREIVDRLRLGLVALVVLAALAVLLGWVLA